MFSFCRSSASADESHPYGYREDNTPHETLEREFCLCRASLIPSSPVRGDYLERHLDAASKIIILRVVVIAVFSALLVGFMCAILWMANMRNSMCQRDPPVRKLGGIRYTWDESHSLGAVVHYQCSESEEESSPIVATLHCTNRRRWEILSLKNESCSCDKDPPKVLDGYYKLSGRKIGSQAFYYCDVNFRSSVMRVAECSAVKAWQFNHSFPGLVNRSSCLESVVEKEKEAKVKLLVTPSRRIKTKF